MTKNKYNYTVDRQVFEQRSGPIDFCYDNLYNVNYVLYSVEISSHNLVLNVSFFCGEQFFFTVTV